MVSTGPIVIDSANMSGIARPFDLTGLMAAGGDT